MKIIAILFFAIALVRGEAVTSSTEEDAYFAPFYRGQPMDNPELGYGSMQMTRKIQSAQLTETALFTEADDDCFKRSLCAIGAAEETEDTWPNLSIGKGLSRLNNFLKLMVNDIQTVDKDAKDHYPHIHQAVASHYVGTSTKDLLLCDTLFKCSMTSEEFFKEAITAPDFESFRTTGQAGNFREGRATCTAVSKLCPGFSIGCSLCGLFSPGTCGEQCIAAGMFCGISSYACAAEKAQEERKKKKVAPRFFFDF